MKTDVITINSDGAGMEKALEESLKFSEYEKFDEKSARRVRLLVEETLGMVRAVAAAFEAKIWIEGEGGLAQIHMTSSMAMDYEKKQGLIDLASDKKNAAAKGFMGKIWEIIQNGLLSIDEVGKLQAQYGGVPLMYGSLGQCDLDIAGLGAPSYMWSLDTYRDNIEGKADSDNAAEEAVDELEKSIVASIADDVTVSVSGEQVELVITYNKK